MRFKNLGEDIIAIKNLYFQSDIHPRSWDTLGDTPRLIKDEFYDLPIVGTGWIFIRWRSNMKDYADSFEVRFDEVGVPYPYYFGGEKWTMLLRHAALHAKQE